jgi:hypothetical protein
MQVVLPAPGGACSTAQKLSASVLCNRSRTASTGRPIHGKLSKFYYFLDRNSFDSDRSTMHKNAKKQFDLQGLVQDQKLTLSYKDIVRFFSAAGLRRAQPSRSRSHERRWTPVGAMCRPASIPACYANEYASENWRSILASPGKLFPC